MSAYERNKGHTYERALAKRLRDLFPDSRRGLQFQNRFASQDQPDVIAGPFAIECKNTKKINIRSAMDQAVRAATPGQYPILAGKLGRGIEGELVVMQMTDWIEIVTEWWRMKNQ